MDGGLRLRHSNLFEMHILRLMKAFQHEFPQSNVRVVANFRILNKGFVEVNKCARNCCCTTIFNYGMETRIFSVDGGSRDWGGMEKSNPKHLTAIGVTVKNYLESCTEHKPGIDGILDKAYVRALGVTEDPNYLSPGR